MENYDQDSEKGEILEIDVKYPWKLQKLHLDLPFLYKRMKIEKCDKKKRYKEKRNTACY